jgi:alpha-beta hydrolase superfamily lysophospholipase
VSIFDGDAFNRALFYPEPRMSPPPAGATDLRIGGIHVRRYAAPSAAVTLLLFHGNGEVVADYDDAAERFADAGAALAVADYRGYGQSAGTPTLRSVIDDARPIAEQLTGKLIVMGRSLGGAAAHELYARPTANMIGVVLESAFSDIAGLILRRGIEPPALTVDERATFDPLHKLPLGRLPLLILHGDRDQLILPAEARAALAAAGSERKTLQMCSGVGHNDISQSADYWRALASFIRDVGAAST